MNYYNDNFIELLKNNKKLRDERKKIFEISEKNISKIIKMSKVIEYPTHREAYDYVDSLFKGSNIKDVKIHLVRSVVLEKYGFGGRYGFFYIPKKMVFVQSHTDNYSLDEVIVHELIHYALNKEQITFTDVEMEEEGAYGWTIGYLRQKGYSDDIIIKKFLMEYYSIIMIHKSIEKYMSVNNDFKKKYMEASAKKRINLVDKHYKNIQKINKDMSFKKSKVLMDIYNEKLKNGNHFSLNSDEEKNVSRFNFMDLR